MPLPLTPLCYQPKAKKPSFRRVSVPTVGMLIILGQITWITLQSEEMPGVEEVPEIDINLQVEPPVLPVEPVEPSFEPDPHHAPVYTPEMPVQPEIPPMQVEIAAGLPSQRIAGFNVASFRPNTNIVPFDTLDRRPGVLKRGALQYPTELRRDRITGMVKLKVMIYEDGSVRVQSVVESTHKGFEKAAIRAAEDSVFERPMRNGKPVRTTFYLPIQFKLDHRN